LFGFEGHIPSPVCRKAAMNLENWITKVSKVKKHPRRSLI
jgi:hypothetical protein